MPISIPSSVDGELTNYQLQITIVKGSGSNSGSAIYLDDDAKNWPDDIRFTSSDGTTLIDFWREESDATDGTWWVEVPTVPASGGTMVYCYYGKSDASDASDGASTFEIFTDFPGDDLPSGWTEYKALGNPVTYAVADSVYTATMPKSTSAQNHAIICETEIGLPSIIRTKHKVSLNGGSTGVTACAGQIGVGPGSTDPNTNEPGLTGFRNSWRGDSSNDWTNQIYPSSENNNTVVNNTWVTKEFRAKSGDLRLDHDGGLFLEGLGTFTMTDGYLKVWSLHSDIQTGTAYNYVDWILVRNYTANPPSPSAGSPVLRSGGGAIMF